MHTAATDPASLPAHKLANAIAARRLSPVDVVAAFLDRIAAQDAKLHAFVEVFADEARLAGEAADKAIRSGHAVGPLHGVPIALKDLIEIEGKVATGGAAIWRNRRAERTATLARRLIAQGMIVIGKTHTVEFAYGGWGTNRHMGTPWNPWDPKVARTPGGSSSGSGVAVAARLVPWAVVADHVLAAYEESLEVLARLGAEIVPIELPFGFADAGALNGRIMSAEAYAILGDIVDDETLRLDEDVRPRIRAGRDISARAYL